MAGKPAAAGPSPATAMQQPGKSKAAIEARKRDEKSAVMNKILCLV
jgi:hypothetical protein